MDITDSLEQSILEALRNNKQPLTARKLRQILLKTHSNATLKVSDVNSKLYSLLAQKDSKIQRVEMEDNSAPLWSLKSSSKLLHLIQKTCQYHLGSRWKTLESEYHELKGTKESTDRGHSLKWSVDEFRQSFNRYCGKTLVAFINTMLKQEEVNRATQPSAEIVFGIYDRSQLIHGIWLDCRSRDSEGECTHLGDQLNLALRQQFQEFYLPKSQYSTIMSAISITISPIVDGLLNGRYFVILVMVSFNLSAIEKKSLKLGSWQDKVVHRDGSSTQEGN